MHQSKKPVPRKSRSGSSSISFDMQIDKLECEGWLYVKEVVGLNHKFVKRWCELNSNHVFHIFTAKAGKLKEQINIEVCRITPIMKHGSSSFYFVIGNEWGKTKFGTENEENYTEWINKLQLLSDIKDSFEGFESSKQLLKHYDSVQGSLSIDSSDDSVPVFDHPYDVEVNDVYESLNDVEIDNPNTTSPSTSRCYDETISNENDSTSTENFNDLPNNNEIFAKMKDLERQIRDKSILLLKINNFLRMSHVPEELDLFWEENREQMIAS